MSGSAASNQEHPHVPRDTFAARLVLVRHELKLSVDEISSRCGVASATWSTWERGTMPRDMAAVCTRIADATGYDLHWLVFGGVAEGAHNPRYVNIRGVTTLVGQMSLPLDILAPPLLLVNA